jgi:hypothetical protein
MRAPVTRPCNLSYCTVVRGPTYVFILLKAAPAANPCCLCILAMQQIYRFFTQQLTRTCQILETSMRGWGIVVVRIPIVNKAVRRRVRITPT